MLSHDYIRKHNEIISCWHIAPMQRTTVSVKAINGDHFQMYYTGISDTVRAIVIGKLIFPKLLTIFGRILNKIKWNLCSIYIRFALLKNSVFFKTVQMIHFIYTVLHKVLD